MKTVDTQNFILSYLQSKLMKYLFALIDIKLTGHPTPPTTIRWKELMARSATEKKP